MFSTVCVFRCFHMLATKEIRSVVFVFLGVLMHEHTSTSQSVMLISCVWLLDATRGMSSSLLAGSLRTGSFLIAAE